MYKMHYNLLITISLIKYSYCSAVELPSFEEMGDEPLKFPSDIRMDVPRRTPPPANDVNNNENRKYIECYRDRIENSNAANVTKEFKKEVDEFLNSYDSYKKNKDEELEKAEFNKTLFEGLLQKAGIPGRLLTKFFEPDYVPKGFSIVAPDNIIILTNSILYFYRLKMVEHNKFQLINIDEKVDLIKVNLSLGDIYLQGTFDHLIMVDNSHYNYFLSPMHSEAELRLRNAKLRVEIYKRHGQHIYPYSPYVVSTFDCGNIRLKYLNATNMNDKGEVVNLHRINLEQIFDKVENILNLWMQNFFTDYLYETPNIQQDKTDDESYLAKGIIMSNKFIDDWIAHLKGPPDDIKSDLMLLPEYNFQLHTGVSLRVDKGTASGLLKSMYRRGSAVFRSERGSIILDVKVGFSNVKVVYEYSASTRDIHPSQDGVLLLSLDEMTANVRFIIKKQHSKNTTDFAFSGFQHEKPVTIIIRENLMRARPNFYPLITHHIPALIAADIKILFTC